MAVNPQATAQIIYRKTTPGPPEKQAFPIALKVPPPIIAAIPKKVKSFTVKTLCNPVCSPSPPSFRITLVDFFLKRWDIDMVLILD
jgi:hypothetical protein